jgi:hypothetical protein
MSCLLCEQTASQLVAIATRSDTASHNRQDLIQSLVPPHYVCNGYLLKFTIPKSCNYPLANKVAKGYSNATVCPSVLPPVLS